MPAAMSHGSDAHRGATYASENAEAVGALSGATLPASMDTTTSVSTRLLVGVMVSTHVADGDAPTLVTAVVWVNEPALMLNELTVTLDTALVKVAVYTSGPATRVPLTPAPEVRVGVGGR